MSAAGACGIERLHGKWLGADAQCLEFCGIQLFFNDKKPRQARIGLSGHLMCDSCVDGVWHSLSCLFVSCGVFLETGVPLGLACLLPLVASEALNPTGWGASVAARTGLQV